MLGELDRQGAAVNICQLRGSNERATAAHEVVVLPTPPKQVPQRISVALAQHSQRQRTLSAHEDPLQALCTQSTRSSVATRREDSEDGLTLVDDVLERRVERITVRLSADELGDLRACCRVDLVYFSLRRHIQRCVGWETNASSAHPQRGELRGAVAILPTSIKSRP